MYAKRDVQLIADYVVGAIKAVDNLKAIKDVRELSIAKTKLEEAEMWINKLAASTPEVV